ncbi:MAG: hypothetical protein UCH28_03565 [Adlercreutzia sp.]|nr:hypothetical protein [Adlercreutzia sp.]
MWGLAIDESLDQQELGRLGREGSPDQITEVVIELPDDWSEEQQMYIPLGTRRLKVYPQDSMQAKAYIEAKYGDHGLKHLEECVASNAPITAGASLTEDRASGALGQSLTERQSLKSTASKEVEFGEAGGAMEAASEEKKSKRRFKKVKVLLGCIVGLILICAVAIGAYLIVPVEAPDLVGLSPKDAIAEVSAVSEKWNVEFYDNEANPIDDVWLGRYGNWYRITGYSKREDTSASRIDGNVLFVTIAPDEGVLTQRNEMVQEEIAREVRASTAVDSGSEEGKGEEPAYIKVESLCEDSLVTFKYYEKFSVLGNDEGWGIDWDSQDENVAPGNKQHIQGLANECMRDVLAIYYTKEGFPLGVFLGEYQGLTESAHQQARQKRDALDKIAIAQAQQLSKKIVKKYAKELKNRGWPCEWKIGESGITINLRGNGSDKYHYFEGATTPLQFEEAIEGYEHEADMISRLTTLPVKLVFYTNSLQRLKTVKAEPSATFIVE